jgi:hypothetical protein
MTYVRQYSEAIVNSGMLDNCSVMLLCRVAERRPEKCFKIVGVCQASVLVEQGCSAPCFERT